MPDWGNSGPSKLTYGTLPPRPKVPSIPVNNVPKPATPAQPAVAPKPAELGTSSVPGAGTPPKLTQPGELKLPTATTPTLNTTVPGLPTTPAPSLASRTLSAAQQGLEAAGNYQTGTWLGSKMVPSAAGAGASLAQKIPAVYGAYALGDAALTPINLLTGRDNLEDLQQSGVHDHWMKSIGNNLARPGRAAWGMATAAPSAIYGGVREYFRGRQLDAMRAQPPRPTGPGPAQYAGFQ